MLVAAASLFTALFAQAATLITADSAIGSSQLDSEVAIGNIINKAEMKFTGDQNDYTNWTQDPGWNKGSDDDAWGADGTIDDPWVIIDLGAIYNLDTITIWTLNPSIADHSDAVVKRMATEVNVWYSSTGTAGNSGDNPFVAGSDFTSLSSGLTVSTNAGAATNDTPNATITGATMTGVQARWVAVEITDALGNAAQQRKGSLSEVQFFRAEAGTVVSIK